VYVAAGGGGDVLAAAMIHEPPTPAAVLTFAWERLVLDPLPGPRVAADFEDLDTPEPGVIEITERSRARHPARSPLPELTAVLDHRLFLLDPSSGAAGLRSQVRVVCRHLGADTVTLVDVGGDVLATGREPTLRSPLADGLALAACDGLPVEADVLVAGPGLDGELPEATVLDRITALGGRLAGRLSTRDAERIRDALRIHPSEASRLLAAAATGLRGTAEIRDHAAAVPLTEVSPAVYRVPASAAIHGSPVAKTLADTTNLEQANDAVRTLVGRSELDYEREKAQRLADTPCRWPDDLDGAIRRAAEEARQRGADYLTPRRLAELLGLRSDHATRLYDHLADRLGGDALLWPTAHTAALPT
jgi:hypothetical protein